ncbi:MAG: hypothetical protein ACRDB9_07625 [Cetobacterium sp.]
MYKVENIYTREVHILKNQRDAAKITKVCIPHISRIIKEKKTTKIGWKIEKIEV